MTVHDAVPCGVPAGFSDPVLDSQRVFRALLAAMSYPGRILRLTPPAQVPEGLCEASWSVLLTLADPAVSLWTDLPEGSTARESIRVLCGSPTVERPGEAELVLLTRPREVGIPCDFRLGTEKRPELGATLVIQTAALSVGEGFALSGPGVCRETFLKVTHGLLDTHFVIPHLVIPSRVHIKGHPLYVPTTAHKVGIQKYPPRHPGETSTHA